MSFKPPISVKSSFSTLDLDNFSQQKFLKKRSECWSLAEIFRLRMQDRRSVKTCRGLLTFPEKRLR